MPDVVLLPDGTVVMVNGAAFGIAGGSPGNSNAFNNNNYGPRWGWGLGAGGPFLTFLCKISLLILERWGGGGMLALHFGVGCWPVLKGRAGDSIASIAAISQSLCCTDWGSV